MSKNMLLPEAVDFNQFEYPKGLNYFLLVPSGMFKLLSKPESPIFDYTIAQLESAWKAMIAKYSRIKLRSFSDKKHRYHYLYKSLLLRRPGYLIVQFFSINEQQSTLLIYSYSLSGFSDFGGNKTLVFDLLIGLKKTADKMFLSS